jgi:hypothetical protein
MNGQRQLGRLNHPCLTIHQSLVTIHFYPIVSDDCSTGTPGPIVEDTEIFFR